MTEITSEQIESLRELAETLTGKRLGNVKDPVKLQAMIDIARADNAETEAKKAATPSAKSANELREEQRAEHLKLVRVHVTAMSPFDKQLKGNIFSVGNSVLGSITRYVPFDVDWHVEKIIYDVIKDKKYRKQVAIKDPETRRTAYTNKFLPAYNVALLDNLTPVELKEHARAMRAREYNAQGE